MESVTEAMWEAARACGVGTPLCVWVEMPEVLGRAALDRAKRVAGELKQVAPGLGHSKALEAVAAACQFPNWHAMHTVASNLIDDFDPNAHWPRPEGGEARVAALAGTFPMLATPNGDCPPEEDESAGMELFAQRLARCANVDLGIAHDVVAKASGASDWKSLQRAPSDSQQPLYSFRRRAEGDGCFDCSPACSKLVEHQDSILHGYAQQSRAEKRDSRKWVEATLSKRPDFLEGWLARATMLDEGTEEERRRAGAVYKEAIAKADALMPAGFKGKLLWGWVDNRFYHRLLYGYMVWNCFFGSKTTAIRLARKQLRMNLQDNLGLRFWLPMLLCADRQFAAAMRAAAKMRQDEYVNGQVALVRSVCSLLNGNRPGAIEWMLRGLFDWPELRPLLLARPEEFGRKENRRTTIPDVEATWNQYAIASAVAPFGDWYATLIHQPCVIGAEQELGALFHHHWRQPDGNVTVWSEACSDKAERLTDTLLPVMPSFTPPPGKSAS